jgi:uncharacterized membrane protein YheB (UPF0754 family)
MIFRPIRPVRVLGIRVQGLLGKRQGDLARSIGRVVGGHLVQHEDIVKALRGLDLWSNPPWPRRSTSCAHCP